LKKPFPNRKTTHLQECVICKSNYCNLYFNNCSAGQGWLNELRNYKVPIAFGNSFFNYNMVESKILQNYLVLKNMSQKQLFQHILKEYVDKNKFRYKINRSIMKDPPPINMEIALNSGSPVCLDCFDDVWFQMVFRYRIDIKPELPKAIRERGICWYGINCKSMSHNEDHSKKLDHICEQTKF